MSSQGTSANLSSASHGPATHTGDGNPTMANANTSNASATTGSTGQAGGDLAKDAQAPFKAVNVRCHLFRFRFTLRGTALS